MAEMISLGAYGNPVGMLPTEAFQSTVQAATSLTRSQAEGAYKQAQAGAERGTRLAREFATDALRRGTVATSKLTAPLLRTARTAQTALREEARELGKQAATGAREDTMSAVKRWAPWAIGGAAAVIGGIWLLRR